MARGTGIIWRRRKELTRTIDPAIRHFISVAGTPLFHQRLNEQFMQGAMLAHHLKRTYRTTTLANSYNTTVQILDQAQSTAILIVAQAARAPGERREARPRGRPGAIKPNAADTAKQVELGFD